MASVYSSDYDPRQLSGTSGAEVSDLRPEQAYDTDLRRISTESRGAVEAINRDQERVGKFIRAAKTAGKYKQQALISEPSINGRVPRSEATIDGSTIPNLGDRFGRGGGTNYANKPQPRFGRPFG